MSAVADVMSRGPVIPVIVIERLEDAVPLAEALVAGGLQVLEVTLRSPCALEAIECIAREVSGALVGAGSVNHPSQVDPIVSAGARFAVSPGYYPALLETMLQRDLPWLPGVVTPGEVMALLAQGIDHMKFFPAEAAGGVAMLKAIGGPLPAATFCPTGGVHPGNAGDYLALDNVRCVGGSWMLPADAVAAGDWDRITALAAEAAALA